MFRLVIPWINFWARIFHKIVFRRLNPFVFYWRLRNLGVTNEPKFFIVLNGRIFSILLGKRLGRNVPRINLKHRFKIWCMKSRMICLSLGNEKKPTSRPFKSSFVHLFLINRSHLQRSIIVFANYSSCISLDFDVNV